MNHRFEAAARREILEAANCYLYEGGEFFARYNRDT